MDHHAWSGRPPFSKKKFAQDAEWERTDAAPGPGESDAVPLPQITSQKALPPAVVKNKNTWVSPVQGAPGIVSAVCACETRYRFAVWDLASLAISTDLGKVWIVLASHRCACAPGAPRAASVGGARTCGASAAVCSLSFQTQLSPSSPFRHFRPPLSLTPPALRVLWVWRHLRQRRDRSAAAAGGVV